MMKPRVSKEIQHQDLVLNDNLEKCYAKLKQIAK